MLKDAIPCDPERRAFLVTLSLATLAAGACATSGGMGAESARHEHEEDEEKEEEGAEVTPGEDLMQEHGVLERILLIYDEAALRLETGDKPFDPALISDSAAIIRRFVEDYHEKQEEDFVFPRLEKAGSEVALVATLKEQHRKGRELTDLITSETRTGAPEKAKLAGLLRTFARMYRPHASREETVLLPAFRKTLDNDGYHELGEKFEAREHQLFGEGGFHDVVAKVSKIEVALGIHDLSRFTPP